MNAVELLAAALPAAPLPPGAHPAPGRCCVLGTEEPTLERKHAIKRSFTNLDLLRAPDSRRVSVRAWRVLTEPKQRQSSWLCTREFHPIDRLAVRRLVLDGMAPSDEPWCAYATTSYKKHGALRAPVNVRGAQRWLFELQVVDCSDRAKVAEWWGRLLDARRAGIPRPLIESLDIDVAFLRKHTAVWCHFEPWARRHYRAPLYRFLTYLLPGKEELKRDGAG